MYDNNFKSKAILYCGPFLLMPHSCTKTKKKYECYIGFLINLITFIYYKIVTLIIYYY